MRIKFTGRDVYTLVLISAEKEKGLAQPYENENLGFCENRVRHNLIRYMDAYKYLVTAQSALRTLRRAMSYILKEKD